MSMTKTAKIPESDNNIVQIEYLVHQSTQGMHYLFEREHIVTALKKTEEVGFEFYTEANRDKVQELLVKIIERSSIEEKQKFIRKLSPEDQDLVIQAYFHLVESTILSSSKHKH